MNVIGCFLSLSRSLDFTHQGLMRHHRRTALIATKLGHEMGMEAGELLQLMQSVLIHDIGVISWQEKLELFHVEIESPWEHCFRGEQLLIDNKSLNHLAGVIASHHDRWSGDNPSGLKGASIPLHSRIIHLADRLDIMITDTSPILDQKDHIMQTLHRLRGDFFDPDLVDLLDDLAKHDSFWFDLASPWEAHLLQAMAPASRVPIQLEYLADIARLFARVVDAKSPFTYRHSRGVALLSRFVGEQLGLSPEELKQLEIAGLLHDLGKLSVPEEILEKPGRLSVSEFNTIKQHPYYTYWLLKPVTQVFPLAEWAAFHHERPSGTGYPFGKGDAELDLQSRIVTVADVFTAMHEDRPYRPSMSWDQISSILNQMAKQGDLNSHMVASLLDNRSLVSQAWDSLG
jgi:HD-GYP domain-containing protein (c-di-GMP phosphodiesterase class II)